MIPLNAAEYAKSEYQKFYTDDVQIRNIMLFLLGSVEGLKVLEPCAGRGAFIDGLHGEPSRLDAIDIDENHIEVLRCFPNFVKPIHADFIDLFVSSDLLSNLVVESSYDAVICNPPYGLKFSVEYRKRIKKRLSNIYARESYGLFMHFAIDSLRKDGRYVFIVPDTFLTSRNHRSLREFIIAQGRPSHIIRFPSKFFGSVNFGYGYMCIIAGNRCRLEPGDKVYWSESTDADADLSFALKRGETFSGEFLISRCHDGWVHPSHLDAVCFDRVAVPLGTIAECRTGIYTGNNSRFCGFDALQPPSRCSNGHEIDWGSSLRASPLTVEEKLQGIEGEPKYVPFVRGGHRKALESTRWAIDWGRSAVETYRNDKKARLQNQSFYFREGLAIPMVTSGRLSASYMVNSVFDQGVVGVFPADHGMVSYLLVYLNSDRISQRLKAIINPGANNSANYVKRIPIIIPTPLEIKMSIEIVDRARLTGWEGTLDEREKLMSSLLGDR